MRIILGGVTLPRHTKLIERPVAQTSKVRTPSGKLGIDTWSLGRAWTLALPVITKAQWQQIYDLYKAQFAGSGALTSLETTAEGAEDRVIPATTVWIEMDDWDIKWAGSHADGVSLTLEEENAIS